MRLLETELGEASAGRGRLVTVASEAGIGKTRVVAVRAQRRGRSGEHALRPIAEARDAAEELGLRRLRARLADLRPPLLPDEPAPARTAILRRDGQHWTVGLENQTMRLKDGPGVAYLATLVREPGREFHVLELAAGTGAPAGAARVVDVGDCRRAARRDGAGRVPAPARRRRGRARGGATLQRRYARGPCTAGAGVLERRAVTRGRPRRT